MATRPLFVPKRNSIGVDEVMIDFDWFPGFSKSQKQKSIDSLHKEAKLKGFNKILEISSKSELELGINLSAFNLIITTQKQKKKLTVETAFQGSKVFEKGGPYKDLFGLDSLKAKKDIRLKESGNLKSFNFFGMEFPILPRTFFYDWLYINALLQNHDLLEQVKTFDAFSDIEFNPEKSINCQAHAVALYLSILNNGFSFDNKISVEDFSKLTKKHYDSQRRKIMVQNSFI